MNCEVILGECVVTHHKLLVLFAHMQSTPHKNKSKDKEESNVLTFFANNVIEEDDWILIQHYIEDEELYNLCW